MSPGSVITYTLLLTSILMPPQCEKLVNERGGRREIHGKGKHEGRRSLKKIVHCPLWYWLSSPRSFWQGFWQPRCLKHDPGKGCGLQGQQIPYLLGKTTVLSWGKSAVKNPPAMPEAYAGEAGSIPGSERSLREENGNALLYFCLENPIDGGAWWATVHGIAKSQTQPSN